MAKIAKCPKNKEHNQFVTTAHECHDWKVDATGEFLEDLGCVSTTEKPYPENGNIWTCVVCGAEAIFVEA